MQPVFHLTGETGRPCASGWRPGTSSTQSSKHESEHVYVHDESLYLQVPGGWSLQLTGS